MARIQSVIFWGNVKMGISCRSDSTFSWLIFAPSLPNLLKCLRGGGDKAGGEDDEDGAVGEFQLVAEEGEEQVAGIASDESGEDEQRAAIPR